MRTILLLLLIGCDEGQVHAPPAPPVPTPAPVVIADAAPQELLGTEPATLGPAFDGLALGQAIDQSAAEQWLKQRGIHAVAYVRDGHLASLAIRNPHVRWPPGHPDDYDDSWISAQHQYATQTETEQGTWLQFDLEVPLEQWLSTSPQSIVPLDLVAKSLEDVTHRNHPAIHSTGLDGHYTKYWTDSALVGAVTATNLLVAEIAKNEPNGDLTITSHELDVSLDGSRALYDGIDRRLAELFGPKRSKKIKLTHTPVSPGVEHIELVFER
jgi:hypothetical protein